jgi:hypothetical protein
MKKNQFYQYRLNKSIEAQKYIVYSCILWSLKSGKQIGGDRGQNSDYLWDTD